MRICIQAIYWIRTTNIADPEAKFTVPDWGKKLSRHRAGVNLYPPVRDYEFGYRLQLAPDRLLIEQNSWNKWKKYSFSTPRPLGENCGRPTYLWIPGSAYLNEYPVPLNLNNCKTGAGSRVASNWDPNIAGKVQGKKAENKFCAF